MRLDQHPKIERYMHSITQHVKNKKAHPHIYEELLTHIEEIVEDKIKQGGSLEEAIDYALQQTGETAMIGKQFHQIYKQTINWSLLGFLFVFIGIGLALMFSFDQYYGVGSRPAFPTQFSAVIIGLCLLFVLLFFDYRKLMKYAYTLFALNQIITLLVLLFGSQLRGVSELHLLGQNIHYIAYVAPIINILAAAGIINKLNLATKRGQLVVVGLFLIPCWLYIITPSFFSVVLYTIALSMLIIRTEMKKKFIFFGSMVIIAFGITVVTWGRLSEYYLNRLQGFLNPFKTMDSYGYHQALSITLVREGGLLGNWFQGDRILFLPDVRSSLIFSYISHEFGWLLASGFVLLCLAFIYRMSSLRKAVIDPFGISLISGISSILAIQFLWSISMSVGLVPIMDVGLPFVSSGGTHFIMSCICLGLLLNVYRNKSSALLHPVL